MQEQIALDDVQYWLIEISLVLTHYEPNLHQGPFMAPNDEHAPQLALSARIEVWHDRTRTIEMLAFVLSEISLETLWQPTVKAWHKQRQQ